MMHLAIINLAPRRCLKAVHGRPEGLSRRSFDQTRELLPFRSSVTARSSDSHSSLLRPKKPVIVIVIVIVHSNRFGNNAVDH